MSEKNTTITGDSGGGRQVSMPVNLPGNTNKAKAAARKPELPRRYSQGDPESTREEKPERETFEQITAKAATKQKQSVFSKIGDALTGEDARSVGNYLMFDVVIPNVKNLINDLGSQGLERLLYGSSSSRSTPRRDAGRDRDHVPYSRISTSRSNTRDLSREDRARHRFDNIFVETRDESESILNSLSDSADRYGHARVTDLYDLVGITGEFTDENWGWNEIAMRKAAYRRQRNGYILLLPAPEYIE